MIRLLALTTAALLIAAVVSVVHRSAARVVGPSRAVAAVQVPEPSPTSAGAVPTTLSRRSHLHRPPNGCTAANWRSKLKPAEKWIDAHESGLNPAAVEPTTHARGLGQLLPSTYAALGLTYSPDPCDQIKAQRLYLQRHYGGSWAAALRHKKETGWW